MLLQKSSFRGHRVFLHRCLVLQHGCEQDDQDDVPINAFSRWTPVAACCSPAMAMAIRVTVTACTARRKVDRLQGSASRVISDNCELSVATNHVLCNDHIR